MFLLEPGRAESLVYTASDLVLSGECEFRLLRRVDELLGRIPRREREQDTMLARTAALGEAHELKVLTAFQARFGVGRIPRVGMNSPPGGVVSVPPVGRMTVEDLTAAHDRTLAALEHGADVVYQASFFDGRFHGRADFLVRDHRPTRAAEESGVPRYAVHDTKLARRAKVRALLQLAAYADQLISAHVDPTDQIHLILGDRTETHHDLGDVLPVFRRRRDRLLRILDEHVADDAPVAWGDDRWVACGRLGVCPDCAQAAHTHRDVLVVKGVYERQRARLREHGITTIDGLVAASDPPDGMPRARFEELRGQARLQLGLDQGHGSVPLIGDVPPSDGAPPSDDETPRERLRWRIVDPDPIDALPTPSPGDIFFDFEGDPLWEEPLPGAAGGTGAVGLDYLFGWVERPPDDGRSGAATKPLFTGLWADDLAAEREALVRFVDHVNARRRRYPDMHVYHYASYEKTHLLSIAARHGTFEDEVDDLLRDGVLVDLYAVVRSAVRTSDRSLSIKKLEPLYMRDDPVREGVVDAASSVIEYAEYAQASADGRVDDAARLRERILRYNEYDCVSTSRLLEWLRWAREHARDQIPAEPRRDLPNLPEGARRPGPDEDVVQAGGTRHEARERRAALSGEIQESVGESTSRRSGAETALALLGAAVEYYTREAKPFWQEHFARLELPVDEWPGKGATFLVDGGRVLREWEVEPGRRTPVRHLELDGRMLDHAQVRDSDLVSRANVQVVYERPVPDVVGPLPERAVRGAHAGGEIVAVHGPEPSEESGRAAPGGDVVVLHERLRRHAVEHARLPMALTPAAGPGHGPQETAVEEAARAALDHWREHHCLPDGPTRDLLERRTPRLAHDGSPLPPPDRADMVGTVERALRDLDRTYLAIQGPPGSGKTHVGSHVVARLVTDGWRVGIVSQSHAAVENMLHATVTKAGLAARAVAKKDDGGRRGRPPSTPPPWEELSADRLARFAATSPAGCVVGGTAWDFAHHRWPAGGLDLLVIDEAGQFSLADTIAVGRSARRLLLLGDPRQLPQVTQGRHPQPVDSSALGWLTAGAPVLPEGFGYFLDTSWRMHPDVCRKVSALAYSGRLGAHPVTAERSLDGIPPGVRHVPVSHAGNRYASPEEAAEVVRQVRAVIGREWTDPTETAPGPRPLDQADVVVVAAYNAQVNVVRQALAEAGFDQVPVGTVDLFQGREAPVAILTLAASSPHDASRGTGFLLSRHRLNVAVSRAQWRAVVVSSPELTDFLPGDLEADGVRRLLDLGAFLRLTSTTADTKDTANTAER